MWLLTCGVCVTTRFGPQGLNCLQIFTVWAPTWLVLIFIPLFQCDCVLVCWDPELSRALSIQAWCYSLRCPPDQEASWRLILGISPSSLLLALHTFLKADVDIWQDQVICAPQCLWFCWGLLPGNSSHWPLLPPYVMTCHRMSCPPDNLQYALLCLRPLRHNWGISCYHASAIHHYFYLIHRTQKCLLL